MSVLLPSSPKQREVWSKARPEPVVLELPGWSQSIIEPDASQPNQRWINFEKDGGRIEWMRYWDTPLNPGYPMARESARDVMVAGRKTELVTTSMFDGAPMRVWVFWLTGEGHGVKYGVRVVVRREEDVETALAAVRVAW